MSGKKIEIVKASGERVPFSERKLRASLLKSGAGEALVSDILARMRKELYPGISSREVYNRAYALLRREKAAFASRYKLKKALFELGPTGFPFERFVAQVLSHSGYTTQVGVQVQGQCVGHEVDILAEKNGQVMMVECKFHSDATRKCDVKVPLYIHSRYQDIRAYWNSHNNRHPLTSGCVATNTQFTLDAIEYGRCAGLELLSWDYPHKDALKDQIDRFGLYPLTASLLLSAKEKDYLLGRDVVLMRQLYKAGYLLDHLGISESRKQKILEEAKVLSNL